MDGQDSRTELLVGLFVFFGLALLGALIVQFGRFEHQFTTGYPLKVKFEDATGIFENVDVKLGGARIGRVTATPTINTAATGVTVELEIFSEFKIPRNATFTIRTAGLMGDSYIAIIPPEGEPSKETYEANAVIEGKTSGIQKITDSVEEISQKVNIILDDVKVTVAEVTAAAKSLDRSFTKLDEEILSDENSKNIKEAIAGFRKTGENLAKTTDKLDPVVDEAKATVANATKAAENASETFEKASTFVDELSPAISELKSAMASANRALSKIESGTGLLPALLSDSSLRNNFEAFAANVREHGILRYKDSAPVPAPAPAPAPAASSSSSAPTTAPAPTTTAPQEKKRFPLPFRRAR